VFDSPAGTAVGHHDGVVPSFSPMLASSGPVAAPASAWAFEPKLDG
jgi:hypothetical protein